MATFLISVGVAAAIAVALLQRPGDRSVAAFAKTYDVPLTSGNVQLLLTASAGCATRTSNSAGRR